MKIILPCLALALSFSFSAAAADARICCQLKFQPLKVECSTAGQASAQPVVTGKMVLLGIQPSPNSAFVYVDWTCSENAGAWACAPNSPGFNSEAFSGRPADAMGWCGQIFKSCANQADCNLGP